METYYFTLSFTQGGPGCVKIKAESWDAAREKMFNVFKDKWSFQYNSIDEVHPADRKILLVIQ